MKEITISYGKHSIKNFNLCEFECSVHNMYFNKRLLFVVQSKFEIKNRYVLKSSCKYKEICETGLSEHSL
jgi:hypothetical protein